METEPEPYESLEQQYHTAVVAANALYLAIQSLEAERSAYLRVIQNIMNRAQGYPNETHPRTI